MMAFAGCTISISLAGTRAPATRARPHDPRGLAATKDDEPTANGRNERELKNRLIRVYSCAFAVG